MLTQYVYPFIRTIFTVGTSITLGDYLCQQLNIKHFHTQTEYDSIFFHLFL